MIISTSVNPCLSAYFWHDCLSSSKFVYPLHSYTSSRSSPLVTYARVVVWAVWVLMVFMVFCYEAPTNLAVFGADKGLLDYFIGFAYELGIYRTAPACN